MKKRVLLLLIVFSIFCCDQKERYQGKWVSYHFENSKFNKEVPEYFEIENDSIKFNYGVFNYWDEFNLKIDKDKFIFNGNAINVNIEADTLILNEKYHYFRYLNDSLHIFWQNTPILRVELPKLETVQELDIDRNVPNYYINFGKRLDNGEYSLQLNDRYADIQELQSFLNDGHRHTYPRVYLYIDKSTPLKYLDQMFDKLVMSNTLRIGLINNLNLQINDSENIYYDYEILMKGLPAFPFDPKYRGQLYNSDFIPGPPPPPPPPNLNMDQSKTDYVFLINNEMFYNKTRINQIQLKDILEKSINNNHTIFTLYDLESNYGSFLEMNAIINNAYKEKREQKSKSRYNKSFKVLTKDERREVYLEIPMKHLWSYSILHYQSIFKNNNPIFGDDLKSIDSMLPKKR